MPGEQEAAVKRGFHRHLVTTTAYQGGPTDSALQGRRVADTTLVVFGSGAPQQGFAFIAQLTPGCFHELRTKLPFPGRQRW